MRRVQSIRGILESQRRMQRAIEWEVAALRRDEEALVARQRDVVRALDRDAIPAGRLGEAMIRHLHGLAQEAARLAETRAARERDLLAHALKVKRAERLLHRVEAQARVERDRRELRQLLERAAQPAGHDGA